MSEEGHSHVVHSERGFGRKPVRRGEVWNNLHRTPADIESLYREAAVSLLLEELQEYAGCKFLVFIIRAFMREPTSNLFAPEHRASHTA